jgi:hypothetical protein
MPVSLRETFAAAFTQLARGACIGLAVNLLASCATGESGGTSPTPRPTLVDEKEAAVPTETKSDNSLETPELPPAVPSAKAGEPDEVAASMTEGPITITSDVVIPSYQPLDLPYSQWEAHRSQELLEANGYGATADEWRRAAEYSDGLIRAAATYLLTREPEQGDEDLFHRGLADDDQAVQALSAYGLYRLGDPSALPVLERVARLDPAVYLTAAQAAGLLAELGDPTAFATLLKAMGSDLRYVRLIAMQNAMSFVPFHGRAYAPGETIDIWELYRRALEDPDIHVGTVARLQLEELNTAEALELLQSHP